MTNSRVAKVIDPLQTTITHGLTITQQLRRGRGEFPQLRLPPLLSTVSSLERFFPYRFGSDFIKSFLCTFAEVLGACGSWPRFLFHFICL
jgi:hypothetical protein